MESHIPKKAYAEQWDIDGLAEKAKETLAMEIPFADWAAEEGIADEEMLERLKKTTEGAFTQLTDGVQADDVMRVEKQVLLQVIDRNWQDHLRHLDALRSVIGLRAHGQRDPLNEYKSEAFTLFDKLLSDLREGVTQAINRLLINVQIQRQQAEAERAAQAAQSARSPMEMVNQTAPSPENSELDPEALKDVSRNSPCPCGSGKKVKHCHGKA